MVALAARRRTRQKKKPPPASRPAAKTNAKKDPGVSRRVGAWVAGVLAAGLATALGVWLTGLGSTVAAHIGKGPALTAVADVLEPSQEYVLTTPVTSSADRLTLQGGYSTADQVLSLFARHGGVPVDMLNLTLVLQGHRDDIRIINIQPQVVPAGAAPSAAFAQYPSAGTATVYPVSVNMSSAFPGLTSGGTPYFSSHEIDLTNGENFSFGITFTLSAGFREVRLIVTYVTGGSQDQLTVSGQDMPDGPDSDTFELAAPDTDYHDYGTVYQGLSASQFEVASASQACGLFPGSRGCR